VSQFISILVLFSFEFFRSLVTQLRIKLFLYDDDDDDNGDDDNNDDNGYNDFE
jgi:hypothetical protein